MTSDGPKSTEDKGETDPDPPVESSGAVEGAASDTSGSSHPPSIRPASSIVSSTRRTPNGGVVYLQLPLRGGKSKLRLQSQPKGPGIGKTVSMNRFNSQQPLGGDRPIPPLPRRLESCSGRTHYSCHSSKPATKSTKPRPQGDTQTLQTQQWQLCRVPSESSRMTSLNGSTECSSAKLSVLTCADHLFTKRCPTFPSELAPFEDLLIKRQIINPSGRCIFYSGQRVNRWRCWGYPRHEFTYHVFDSAGRTALVTKGYQTIPGFTAFAEVQAADGSTIGVVIQDFCDALYTVKDGDGETEFRIRGPCYGSCAPCVFWCFEEHFEIELGDGVTEIGAISTHWKKGHPDQDGMWGINFPLGFDNKQKALLLGASLLIHFQFYRRGGNGVWICALLALLLLAFLASWFTTEGYGVLREVTTTTEAGDIAGA